MTVLSQCCHSVATVLPQCCDSSFVQVSEELYNGPAHGPVCQLHIQRVCYSEECCPRKGNENKGSDATGTFSFSFSFKQIL